MDINNQTELELYFADHFDTVLFPVLADIYQSKADYIRAKRVCEIGLEHHPESVDGQFILSQAEMALGNLTAAEKLLKKVLDKETIPDSSEECETCSYVVSVNELEKNFNHYFVIYTKFK